MTALEWVVVAFAVVGVAAVLVVLLFATALALFARRDGERVQAERAE